MKKRVFSHILIFMFILVVIIAIAINNHRNNITDFMEEAYAYCLKYEKEIRKHIEMEENAF